MEKRPGVDLETALQRLKEVRSTYRPHRGRASHIRTAGPVRIPVSNNSIKNRIAKKSGQIYVIEFTSCVVKVGYSTNAEKRMLQHAKAAIIWGQSTIKSYASDYMDDALGAESELVALGRAIGTPIYDEWFKCKNARPLFKLAYELSDRLGWK